MFVKREIVFSYHYKTPCNVSVCSRCYSGQRFCFDGCKIPLSSLPPLMVTFHFWGLPLLTECIFDIIPCYLCLPESEELERCKQSLLFEQREALREASMSTLSSVRLRQRLIIFERFFEALARQTKDHKGHVEKKEEVEKSKATEKKKKRY